MNHDYKNVYKLRLAYVCAKRAVSSAREIYAEMRVDGDSIVYRYDVWPSKRLPKLNDAAISSPR